MGLGQWTLDAVVARPIRPCCAESTPCVRRRTGSFDSACRCSSVKVRMPRSVTRTLPCHIAEAHKFLAASFARNRRFRDFLKFGTFGGCASGLRDDSESSRSTLSVTRAHPPARWELLVLAEHIGRALPYVTTAPCSSNLRVGTAGLAGQALPTNVGSCLQSPMPLQSVGCCIVVPIAVRAA